MPRTLLAIILFALVAGCAHQQPKQTRASVPTTQQPQLDPKALLTLDQIEPIPQFPTTQPATSPSRPPLESLELYARARDALATGHRFTAISSLERAIVLDPDEAELYFLLSRAYLASGNTVKAAAMLQRGCELDPQDGRSQMALGRLQLLRGDAASALTSLRLTLQTRDYAKDEATATLTDYFLARALQQLGYDRAALDQYQKMLARLSHPNLALRSDRELGEWLARPESVFADVARLSEKLNQPETALQAWRAVLRGDPDDFDARSHAINTLIVLGRNDEAMNEAVATVQRLNASPKSIDLLREVARRLGKEDAVYEAVRRVLRDRPNDRAALFALADLLASGGHADDAEKLLTEAARQKWDLDILTRLVRFYSDRQKSAPAAKLLMEAGAARADEFGQIVDLYEPLLDPLRRDGLRASDVAKISAPKGSETIKQIFVYRAARRGNRPTLAQGSLDRAVAADPIFPPALREAMDACYETARFDAAKSHAAAEALVARAENSGIAGLKDELRGIMQQREQRPAEAIISFEAAARAHQLSAESAMLMVGLLSQQGEFTRAEQLLWRVISDHPEFDQAYSTILDLYSNGMIRQSDPRAATLNVLQRWLNNNPSSIAARIINVSLLYRTGAQQEAMDAMNDLVRQNPADRGVVSFAVTIFTDANAMAKLARTFEQIHEQSPTNVLIINQLVLYYQQTQRPSDAIALVDALKDAAAKDARLMYLAATLYNNIPEREKGTATLDLARQIDPNDAAINNDLGYNWADRNENLQLSEKLIRRALDIEPDNTAFLDSLGWVLYKRGDFKQAKQVLQQAIAADDVLDPTKCDHLGDVLYRLQDASGARAQWLRGFEQSMRIPELHSALATKLEQQNSGKTVEVAPIGEQKATNEANAQK